MSILTKTHVSDDIIRPKVTGKLTAERAQPVDAQPIVPPQRIIIDFLEGTDNKKDAAAFARNFIETHFDAHGLCYWHVRPYEMGFIYEVHEGGSGKEYISSVVDMLNKDPRAVVVVRSATRLLEIKRTRSGNYSAVLLPDGQPPTSENFFYAKPNKRMKPFKFKGLSILITGTAVFGVGAVCLILSMLACLIAFVSQPRYSLDQATSFNNLPLNQWSDLVRNTNVNTYVKTMRFEDGRWQFETGERKSEVDISQPSSQAQAVPVSESGENLDDLGLDIQAPDLGSNADALGSEVPDGLDNGLPEFEDLPNADPTSNDVSPPVVESVIQPLEPPIPALPDASDPITSAPPTALDPTVSAPPVTLPENSQPAIAPSVPLSPPTPDSLLKRPPDPAMNPPLPPAATDTLPDVSIQPTPPDPNGIQTPEGGNPIDGAEFSFEPIDDTNGTP